jgi:hypothetical protein
MVTVKWLLRTKRFQAWLRQRIMSGLETPRVLPQ